MQKIISAAVLFGVGGGVYVALELLWRGKSHWTMFCVGGFCFLMLRYIDRGAKGKIPLPLRCLLGAAAITFVEFCSGCIVNLWIRWQVWDYSKARLNLLGQICPRNTFFWLLLTAPAFFLGEHLHRAVDAVLRRFIPR